MSATTSVYDSAQPRRPIITELAHFWEYRGLIKLLVDRDLTVRYKRSVLGVWWTLLNPLLNAVVFWIVFSQIFRFGQGIGVPYIVYLLSGILLQTFFQQGVTATGSSIVNSSSILAKVHVPAEVFSFSTAMAGCANFLISLVPLLLIMILTGVGIPWTAPLAVIPALALLALIAGTGMLVASAAVHFYDIIDFTGVLAQMATFLIPTFYPLDIVPERFVIFIKMNPLYAYLLVFRGFIYEGVFAPWWTFVVMFATSTVILSLGVWVFSRSWKNLVATL